MGLSQALMNRIARQTLTLNGERNVSVTVLHRATASASQRTYGPFPGILTRYDDHATTLEAVTVEEARTRTQKEDQMLRLATADVAWIPTLYDEMAIDGMGKWRVLEKTHGPGYPFWHFRLRRVA